MTHVVTEKCRLCRYTECVSVCPVECFHFDDKMTYIDPEVCIDCGGCIPVCPVKAIFDSYNLPPDLSHWEDVNRQKSLELPVLCTKLDPLPTADQRRIELGY